VSFESSPTGRELLTPHRGARGAPHDGVRFNPSRYSQPILPAGEAPTPPSKKTPPGSKAPQNFSMVEKSEFRRGFGTREIKGEDYGVS